MDRNKDVLVIRGSVHGNVGVGKSTFVEQAELLFGPGNPDIRVIGIREPCEAWSRSGMLSCVIDDPREWGTSVQYGIVLTRCTYAAICERDLVRPAVQSGAHRVVVVLYERTLLDDREIFARHAIRDPVDWQLYEALVARTPSAGFDKVVRMIYLYDSDATCMEHIAKRDRPGEKGYKPETIAEFGRRHEEMMRIQEENGADVQRVHFPDGADADEQLIRGQILSLVEAHGK